MNTQPWISLRDACKMFGMSFESAKNAILEGRFPVATYKLGKSHVIDRDVMDKYFMDRRQEGMAKLANPGPPRPDRRRRRRAATLGST
jgi:hypothetical protein